MAICYVYILKHPITGEPFYVGKGSKKRWYDHIKRVKGGKSTGNHIKDSIISKLLAIDLEPVVEFVAENLEEETAYLLEVETIAKIGRIITKTGPLTNLTPGGDAPPKGYGRIPSEKQLKAAIENIRGKHTGCNHSPEWLQEHKERHTGSKRSVETKQKISVRASQRGSYDEFYGPEKANELKAKKSQSMKGKNTGPRSAETKAKIKAAKKNVSDETRKKISDARKKYLAERNRDRLE